MYRVPGSSKVKSPRIYPYMESQANASKVLYVKDIMHSYDFINIKAREVNFNKKDYNLANHNNGKTQPRFV